VASPYRWTGLPRRAASLPSLLRAVGTNDAPDIVGMAAEVRRARAGLPAGIRLLWVNVYTERSTAWRDVDLAVASQPGVEVVDWAAANLSARGTAPRSPLLSDGVHLSCQGAGVWQGLLRRALTRSSTPSA